MALPKTFTGGERLFAADLNSNFEDLDTRLSGIDTDDVAEGSVSRYVKRFADASARSTAIPSPAEGMVSYLDDIDSIEIYDGTAWTSALNTIRRSGTDNTQIQVADDGQINVADDTSPTPVVRALPFAIDTGVVNVGSQSGGSNTSGTTTFPSGRFTSAPTVIATHTDPARNFPWVYTTSITSTSFGWTSGNTSTLSGSYTFQYFAIQHTA